MEKKKIVIKALIGYLLLMGISTFILNSVRIYINSNIIYNILQVVLQFICSIYLIYIINKFYGWNNAGFTKVNIKSLIWFIPHIFIIMMMMYTLGKGMYINSSLLNIEIWILLVMHFVGCILAGASEEIIFRGMIVNSFKTKNSIKKAMLIGSLGFGVIHIATIFIGMSPIDAIAGAIRSCLLGIALVPLTIKINNILPAIIFHVLWNFILIASNILNIELSKYYLLANSINIIIGVVLGFIVAKEYKNSNRKYRLSEQLIEEISTI